MRSSNVLADCTTSGRASSERRRVRQNLRIILTQRIPLKIVVADDLPASALELIRAEAGWTIDARSGRTPDALARDLAGADGILVRSATKVTAALMDAAP